MVWLFAAQPSTRPATAAAANITSAYSAVVCPDSARSNRVSIATQTRNKFSCTATSSDQVREHLGFGRGSTQGEAVIHGETGSGMQPRHHDGDHGEQRECGGH